MCGGDCQAAPGSEHWPRLRWALQVWARWPHLAELELRPDDVLGPMQLALERTPPSSACPLGQLAWQLFLLCSLGGAEKVRVVAENAEALSDSIGLVLACPLWHVIDSGWPIFSLLALLDHTLLADSNAIASAGTGMASVLVKRVSTMWASPPPLGPPPPPEVDGRVQRAAQGQLLGCSRRFLFASSTLGMRHPLFLATVAAMRAACTRQHRLRKTHLAAATRFIRQVWQGGASAPMLFRSRWPVYKALSISEAAIIDASARQASSGESAATPLGFVPTKLEAMEFEAALVRQLERRLDQSSQDVLALASISGAVLPSEAFLFHALATMVGATVIVESGVGRGGSTRAACSWAREVPGRRVVSLERAWPIPFDVAQSLQLACGGLLDLRPGDAFSALDGVLLASSGAANAKLHAVHDVPRLDSRYCDAQGRHLTRSAMEAAPYVSVFSDQQWYVSRFASRLDGGFSKHVNTTDTGSYGPTLGALVAWVASHSVKVVIGAAGGSRVALRKRWGAVT
eukprot:CAMPEP_0117587416 /NCGR_PEP_ID=MMETSP0784-20121206/69287_1 /TAXON_ID=39447 /ORGANISM="" /LENGTH=514 /DNA_ID=CAMNT_0005388669 /DNA_START=85 /DNA_END=1626 /DNA_ORIENTATION=-